MIKSSKLPFVPGYSFEREVGQTRFHKSTMFEYLNGQIPYMSEAERPGTGGYPISWMTPDTTPSIYPRRETKELPGWLAFDKQILTFEAYFQEAMWEIHKSPYQVRKVKIYYFPEDGTVQVVEPKVPNSGMSQGLLIARQRIRFPKPMDHAFYDMVDFNIGKNVELFGRVFRIVNCDKFTRDFLNRMGIFVGDPLNYPVDPYQVEEEKKKKGVGGKKPRRGHAESGKYLEFDKKVLRFYGYWDEGPNGTVHRLEIHFFLADDTMEIIQILPPNSGSDASSTFLKRMKIPKIFVGVPGPGEEESYTLLNVLPTGFLKGKYVLDPISAVTNKNKYYRDNDLAIGVTINVFGRKVILADCDDFTKEYYRTKYGLDTFEKIPIPENKCEVFVPSKFELPPWNGIGSYEDSEVNCRKVILEPPKKDFVKFLTKGRKGIDSNVLRFKAKMISIDPINESRVFIISYYLADDQISVYERGITNSGFNSQYFSKKKETFKPDQEKFVSVKPDTYQKEDFWLGNTLNLDGFKFKLVCADEYCLRYMELHCQEFPKSNISLILNKIREKLRPIYKDFVNCYWSDCTGNEGSGVLSFKQLKKALIRLLGDEITEHEIITVARRFRMPGPDLRASKEEVVNACRTESRRQIWMGLDRLRENLDYQDPCHTGFISEKTALTLCKGAKVPIGPELLNKVMQMVDKNECGQVSICDLLNFFDASCIVPVVPFNQAEEFSDYKVESRDYSWIDCVCLLKSIGLEEELAQEGHAEGINNTEITPAQASTLPH